MTARLLDGKAMAAEIRAEIRAAVDARRAAGQSVPGLAVVLVGAHPASLSYVRAKGRAADEVGFRSEQIDLPETTTQVELLRVVAELNRRTDIHGILVQLPLPLWIDPATVIRAIDPAKDVDGFHPVNVGLSFVGDPAGFGPATPTGILALLRRSGIETRGRHAVVVGRSLIVGKPLASLLMAPGPDATVTLAHRHSVNLAEITQRADLIVTATGVPGLITAAMVKPGATVIDVGITRVADPATKSGHRLVGDVAFDEVAAVAGAITPVPGGVGPMTIAALLGNTLLAAERLDNR